eukprot:CAMPEP_0177760022 /NCGR_PEP_ID=MMETSP0491_2-20121128/5041_1 /TAXON_ID=63592 /ORGANISM="Tetraselmis chuii, Strain PLY429" /LENGTH=204 /DNA_ID=CAMNT_0019275885 /DNA_START=164 /DNA_END=778 /DNA_ORIENTATION=-
MSSDSRAQSASNLPSSFLAVSATIGSSAQTCPSRKRSSRGSNPFASRSTSPRHRPHSSSNASNSGSGSEGAESNARKSPLPSHSSHLRPALLARSFPSSASASLRALYLSNFFANARTSLGAAVSPNRLALVPASVCLWAIDKTTDSQSADERYDRAPVVVFVRPLAVEMIPILADAESILVAVRTTEAQEAALLGGASRDWEC